MKSKATGCRSISTVFSRIVLLCVSSIILAVIIVIVLIIIIIIIIIIMLVFVLALIPLSLILRKAKAAYEFSESKEKINHLLFMDDLKLYS